MVEVEGIRAVDRLILLVDGLVGGREPQRRLDRCWVVLEAYRGKGKDLIQDLTSWKGLFMRSLRGVLYERWGSSSVGEYQAVPFDPSAVGPMEVPY